MLEFVPQVISWFAKHLSITTHARYYVCLTPGRKRYCFPLRAQQKASYIVGAHYCGWCIMSLQHSSDPVRESVPFVSIASDFSISSNALSLFFFLSSVMFSRGGQTGGGQGPHSAQAGLKLTV